MNLKERFDLFEDEEYLKFERVEVKRSGRPDLHAFLLLDKLCPDTRDIISASEHDEFYLSIDIEKFEEIVTDDQIKELVRCGIRLCDEECLCMFA